MYPEGSKYFKKCCLLSYYPSTLSLGAWDPLGYLPTSLRTLKGEQRCADVQGFPLREEPGKGAVSYLLLSYISPGFEVLRVVRPRLCGLRV